MPSRILREGITDSAAVNRLTAEEERLFYRLIVTVDDFGRIDARPSVIRSRCFPLRDDITQPQVAAWLSGLQVAALLDFYAVDGKLYQHSAKPAEVAEWIERAYEGLPRVELFCRSPRTGWDVWGNQARLTDSEQP